MKKAIAVTLALCMLLCTACAAGGETPAGQETAEQAPWRLVSAVTLQDAPTYFDGAQIVGDEVWLLETKWDPETKIPSAVMSLFSAGGQPLRTLTLALEPEPDCTSWPNLACRVGADGTFTLVLLAQQPAGGLAPLSIYRFSPQGEPLSRAPIASMQGFDNLRAAAADAAGNMYLLMDAGEASALLSLSPEGGCSRTALEGVGGTLALDEQGLPYATVQAADHTWKLIGPATGGISGGPWGNFPTGGASRLCFLGQTALLSGSAEGLQCVDLASGSQTQLLAGWLEVDVLPSQLLDMTAEGEQTIRALYYTQDRLPELATLTCAPASGQEEAAAQPQIVTVAMHYTNRDLQRMVLDFNRTHPQYRVELYDIMQDLGEVSYDECLERVQRDLLTDNGKWDMVQLINLDVQSLARAGAFEDLGPWLDAPGGFAREDLFESALASNTVDGILVTLPPTVEITLLAGRQSQLGAQQEWTLRQMVDFAAQHPQARVFAGSSQTTLLDMLGMGTDFFFVPQGEGVVFDRQLCADFIRLVQNNPDLSTKGTSVMRLQQGKALLDSARICEFGELQLMQARFGEPVSYIGYPTAQAAGGCLVEPETFSDCDLAICKNAAAKEGAWAFWEYCLENWPLETSLGFSSVKARFDELAQQQLEDQWQHDESGQRMLDDEGQPIPAGHRRYSDGERESGTYWEYEFRPITQEDVDAVRALLERDAHSGIGWRQQELYGIFLEDLRVFQAGKKTLEETVDIMEDRMSTLYHEIYG